MWFGTDMIGCVQMRKLVKVSSCETMVYEDVISCIVLFVCVLRGSRLDEEETKTNEIGEGRKTIE